MVSSIVGRLSAFSANLTDSERNDYKLLLALACGGMLSKNQFPVGSEAELLKTTVTSLANLQPHGKRITPTGIAWRGRPDFMTDELLSMLKAESVKLYAGAKRYDDHLVSTGGTIAKQLGFSEQLLKLVTEHVGSVVSTGHSNYLYYDTPGFGIDPHVDNEDFSLNTILMLEHNYSSRPSSLVLYPIDTDPIRIFLKPGELIVIFSDSVVHARERMKSEESVKIVTFGFQPI